MEIICFFIGSDSNSDLFSSTIDLCEYYPLLSQLENPTDQSVEELNYDDPNQYNDSAATLTTTNLNNTLTNNISAYQTISQRNDYYKWANAQMASLDLKWFKAADIVTDLTGVGAADFFNFGFMLDSTEDFLRKGNEYLFKYNMENAKNLILNGQLTGSFINGDGNIVSFDGKTGIALDYVMVEFEQTKINSFITEYKNANGLSDAAMNAILDDISLTMNRHSLFEISSVMDSHFSNDSFSFGDYHHRVILGEALIDQLHQN